MEHGGNSTVEGVGGKGRNGKGMRWGPWRGTWAGGLSTECYLDRPVIVSASKYLSHVLVDYLI